MPLGFVNIYRSGHWHKPGKPGAYDVHGGDVYATAMAAFNAIEQPHLYLTTVPVEWEGEDLRPNFDARIMDMAVSECVDCHRSVTWLDPRS